MFLRAAFANRSHSQQKSKTVSVRACKGSFFFSLSLIIIIIINNQGFKSGDRSSCADVQ
jgi:hypothetical protein